MSGPANASISAMTARLATASIAASVVKGGIKRGAGVKRKEGVKREGGRYGSVEVALVGATARRV